MPADAPTEAATLAAPGPVPRLAVFLRERCLVRASSAAAEGRRIVSASGGSQSWLLDLRVAFLDPEALDLVATAFWDRFAGRLPFRVAGVETAAVPLVAALLLKARSLGLATDGLVVRKERKATGLGQAVEGAPADGRPVVLVDDLANSGASLERGRVALNAAGHALLGAFVVVDYRSPKGLAWRRERGVGVESLFALSEFGLSLTKRAAAPPPAQRYAHLWSDKEPGANAYHVVPKSAPLLVGDRLYVGSDSGHMRCLDAATGRRLWRFRARGAGGRKGIWSSPAHHAGRLYFGAYNGDVYCLDAESGEEAWCLPACEWVGSSPLLLPGHGLLVVGLEYERPGARGAVAALSLETGERAWEVPLREYQHGSAAHWLGGDLVVVGTGDHDVRALRPATGEEAWRHPTGRSVKYAPAVDEERGLVLAASFDRSLHVLDAATGAARARIETGNVLYTTPLVAGGRYYFGSGDRKLYSVDAATLEVAARRECGARVYSSPRLVGGRVAFGCSSGVVREVDPATLETLGRLQAPDAVTNAVAATPSGSVVFVPTAMNEVLAYARL